jgi:hypothetical protein
VISGDWSLRGIFVGSDNRPSTSKLQFTAWTIVALFSYAAISAARVAFDKVQVSLDVPANLLIAMGLSITTAVGAKAVTVSYVTSGRVNKPAAAKGSLADFLRDDSGNVDLTKVQMLAWTAIAIGVYLISETKMIYTFTLHATDASVPPLSLPDIDPALMVLMGLGQGAYLGAKLITTTTPRLAGIDPTSGRLPTKVTLRGAGFTDDPGASGGIVTIDGLQAEIKDVDWKDAAITCTLQGTRPDGTPWSAGPHQIGVSLGGQISPTTAPFRILGMPRLLSVVPPSGTLPATVTLHGVALTNDPVANQLKITVNGEAGQVTVVSWSDTQIVCTIPAKRPDSSDWPQVLTFGLLVGSSPGDSTVSFTTSRTKVTMDEVSAILGSAGGADDKATDSAVAGHAS